jgi:hypothetical protein
MYPTRISFSTGGPNKLNVILYFYFLFSFDKNIYYATLEIPAEISSGDLRSDFLQSILGVSSPG